MDPASNRIVEPRNGRTTAAANAGSADAAASFSAGGGQSDERQEAVRDVGARSARGGAITTAIQFISAIISFGTQLLLARYLLPDQFGLIAPAASLAAFAGVLRDTGAGQILIQRHKDFSRIAGSIFWLTLFTSCVAALITAGCAPLFAHVWKSPILLPLILLMALRFPIGTIGIISNADLAIHMRWGVVGMLSLLQPAVILILSAVMAAAGAGVYSLVVPSIVADLIRGIAVWSVVRPKVPMSLHWAVVREVISSSGYIVVTNATLVARGYSDYLVLSLVTNKWETGLYFFAFTTAQALARLVTNGGISVLTPAFARLRDDKTRHDAAFTRALHGLAVLGFLPLVLQASLGQPLFDLFLSPRWHAAAVLFSILTLLNLGKYLNAVTVQSLTASGHFKQIFKFALGYAPFELGLFVVGAFWKGALGVAIFAAISAWVDLVVFQRFALHILDLRWRRTFLPLWRVFVAAIPVVVIAYLLQKFVPWPAGAIGHLLVLVSTTLLGSAVYVACLFLVWREVSIDIVYRLRQVFSRS